MSTILGANGQLAEPTADAPRMSTTEVRETRDVRLVSSGILHLNLSMTIHRLNMHHMMLQQVEAQMKQQKVIIDPPEVQHLRALIENDLMARDVMVREIDHRLKSVDEARIAEVAYLDSLVNNKVNETLSETIEKVGAALDTAISNAVPKVDPA